MYSKSALMDLVRQLALQLGDFTLASGKKSKYYLDCRKVTLDSAGANLIADGMLEGLGDNLPDAVGGMAIGADPITAAVVQRALVRLGVWGVFGDVGFRGLHQASSIPNISSPI